MSLLVLAYNLKRVMSILGIAKTMKAVKLASAWALSHAGPCPDSTPASQRGAYRRWRPTVQHPRACTRPYCADPTTIVAAQAFSHRLGHKRTHIANMVIGL